VNTRRRFLREPPPFLFLITNAAKGKAYEFPEAFPFAALFKMFHARIF